MKTIDRRKLLLGSAATVTTAALSKLPGAAEPISPFLRSAMHEIEMMREFEKAEIFAEYMRHCIAEIARCTTGPGISYADMIKEMPNAD